MCVRVNHMQVKHSQTDELFILIPHVSNLTSNLSVSAAAAAAAAALIRVCSPASRAGMVPQLGPCRTNTLHKESLCGAKSHTGVRDRREEEEERWALKVKNKGL